MPAENCSFRWLPTGHAWFASMLEDIGRARRRILLETYIYADDRVGRQFLEALVSAARRGAKVQLLVDAFGSITLPDPFWDPLRAAGGEVAWFNRLSLRRATFRDHRKLLVCDDSTAFVGGFNFAEAWEGDGVTQGWKDVALRIEGPLIDALALSFDEMYQRAALGPPRFRRLSAPSSRRRVAAAGCELILSGPGSGRSPIKVALRQDLAAARRVRIVGAYFMPPLWLRRALVRVVHRGGRVQLMLAGKSDVPLMQLATHGLYQRLLQGGVELYEYEPQILHEKLIVIDDVVYVGSADLDPRSLYINYELLLRIPAAHPTAEAAALFDADLAHCRQVDLRLWRKSRTFWAKLKEQWARFVMVRLELLVARRQLDAWRQRQAVVESFLQGLVKRRVRR